MHNLLIWSTLGFYGAAMVNLFLGERNLRRFADEVGVISSERELELFKAQVKWQMYVALVQIPLLSLPMMLFVGGFMLKVLTRSDLPYLVVPAVAVIGLSLVFKRTETRVKHLPAATPELARERDAIVSIWMKKALPDW